MGKLMKLNVLIVGQLGLGVEQANNLILAGPKSVTLMIQLQLQSMIFHQTSILLFDTRYIRGGL